MITRRDCLSIPASAALTAAIPALATAQMQMPTRAIPASGEMLPVLGLGSSKPVSQIGSDGIGPLMRVLETLVAHGGSVVDTWPRDPANDAGLGEAINQPQLRNELFVTTKIDREGRDAGIAQFRETLELYGREQIDLLQIFSLTDLATHWPTLQAAKAAGTARYIGVTVAEQRLYGELEQFLRREQPDFIQVNYSISEREAEDRLLPLAADRGIAVLINRPFMNGTWFDQLDGVPLPGWLADIGCESWAQFSLKYILANTAVTCVLTETTSTDHMAENARAAFGVLPDEPTRARMRALLDAI